MTLIQLHKNTKYDLTEFFEDNKKDWVYFHPHKANVKTLNEILKKSNKDFYGILVNKKNEIIGYGILRGWDKGFDIPSLGIIINKKFRGKGFSTKLMEELHNICRKRESKTIRLTVDKKNYNAIQLYKKLGYDLTEKDKKNLVGFKQL
jgi:ribosomal protein S18 acetylase RimI-like enzyme